MAKLRMASAMMPDLVPCPQRFKVCLVSARQKVGFCCLGPTTAAERGSSTSRASAAYRRAISWQDDPQSAHGPVYRVGYGCARAMREIADSLTGGTKRAGTERAWV